MREVTAVTGTAAPLNVADIDTDQIIPAVWMKRIERSGFERGLFQQWRTDPDFILNQKDRAGATILVAGPNFGCGSSREHAPWALRDYGFQAVIAPSIADIFRNNLPNVGLVPVVLPGAAHRELLEIVEGDASARLTIDLERQIVSCAGHDFEHLFSIDETARYQLLNGKDPIDLTLEFEQSIAGYEVDRPWWMPVGDRTVERPFEVSGVAESW